MKKTISFALSLLGLFVSIYLLWVYASPSHPMVCLGTGCDEVRASAYAHFLGIPTPVFGVVFYFLLAVLLFLEASRRGTFYTYNARSKEQAFRVTSFGYFILAYTAIGVVVSAALTYIEGAIIHAWCAWCVTQAIVATLIFLLLLAIFAQARRGGGEFAKTGTYVNVVIAAVAVGCVAFYFLQRAETTLPPPPPSMEAIASKLVRPDSHVTGNPNASVTFVEFGDMQCPACIASYPIVEQLRATYGDRVRFVFREFPLETIHMFALGAAEAAECAGKQGRFWQMLDRLYASQGQLDDPSIQSYAKEVGLDPGQFKQCVSTDETLSIIRADQQDGLALGVRPTPTFFVGHRRIEGPLKYEQFAAMLNEDLAAQTQQPAATPAPQTKETPPARSSDSQQQTAKAGGLPGQSGGFFNVKGASVDCSTDAPKGPEPPLIHTADAQKDQQQDALFVDVRSSADFSKSHIQGARNLPLLEVETRAGELPKDKTIVVYEAGTAAGDVCAAAKSAARVLISRGYKAVVFQDGLKGWEKSGGAVEK